jgi:hypothetical protein
LQQTDEATIAGGPVRCTFFLHFEDAVPYTVIAGDILTPQMHY